jgi:GMP synthase-like glutamine amidotransferase
MRPLTVFRHIACEGPGYLAEVLERNDVPCDIIRIDQGETVPVSIDDSSGLVFMGGPMSVNDDLPWVDQELALIKQAQAAGLPVLGHCLGGQLISRALGGSVGANPVKEIGWHTVRGANTDAARHWLGDQPGEPELFHWHGETFSIPAGAELLLENDNCAHQAFVIGNTLALQCHVEMTAPMVAEWASLYEDELQNPGDTVQSAQQMTSGLDERIRTAQQVADRLYHRWLEPVLNP